MADARDGSMVDTKWFIWHMWYLSVGISTDGKNYDDCIPFIQKNLIKHFNICETPGEKIKRKIYTKFMFD